MRPYALHSQVRILFLSLTVTHLIPQVFTSSTPYQTVIPLFNTIRLLVFKTLIRSQKSLDRLNSSLNVLIELINITLSLLTASMLSMALLPLLSSLLLTTTFFALICPLITKLLFNCLNYRIFPPSRANGRKSYPLLLKSTSVYQRSILL